MKAYQRVILLSTIIVLLFLVLMTLANRSGLATLFNVYMHQWLSTKATASKSGFVLVELPREAVSTEAAATQLTQIDPLLTAIKQSSPRRIFWVLPDAPLSPEQRAMMEKYEMLSIKVPSYGFNHQGQLLQQDTSKWRPDAGYLIDVDAEWGVARTVPTLAGQEQTLPSPAFSLLPENLTISEKAEFWSREKFINFSRVNINAPLLNINLMSQSSAVSHLIADQDVYLVSDFTLTQSRIKVPGENTKLRWHPVQYHALAVVAVEQNALLETLSTMATLLLLIGLTIGFVVLFIVSSAQVKRFNTVLGLMVMVFLAWLLSNAFNTIPALFEMLGTCLVLILIAEINFIYQRNQSLIRVNNTLDRELLSESVQSHNEQDDFIGSFWSNVANLIFQNLQLQRTIFFQLQEGEVRLKEISSINCDLNDIFEMRRDIGREPYLLAVQSKQAVDASRPYFKNKDAEEFEILAPFFKGAKVLGFWALTTKEPDVEKRRQLKEQVNLLSTQISVLLDLQQQSLLGERRIRQEMQRFGGKEQQQLQDIDHKLNNLISHSNSYISLFSSMSTPAVLFDVFGQLSMVNKALQKITNKANINIKSASSKSISAFDLLSQLLPLNEDSLRNIIRQLTVEQNITVYRFFVTLNDEEFVAVLSSVQRGEENIFGQYAHLQISGLLCEFHSLKEIQNYLEIERGLYDNYLIKIKNYLSTFQMGLIQIERTADNPQINQLSASLNMELKKASDITRRTHYFMNKVTERKQSNALPFTPIQTLQKCLDKIEKNAKDNPFWRGVSFNTNIPTFAALGLGSPDIFEKIINTSLRLLADDAITPKHINILAKQLERDGEDILYFKLENEGYGLPNDQLQQMYEQNLVLGENTILSELLMALQNAKDANMKCRLKSKVGKGYRLSILIEGVGLHD